MVLHPLAPPLYASQRNCLQFWHWATLASWATSAPPTPAVPPGPLEGVETLGPPLGRWCECGPSPMGVGADPKSTAQSTPYAGQVLPTDPLVPSVPDVMEPREEQPPLPSLPTEEEEEEEEELEEEEEEEEGDSQVQGEQSKVCVLGRRGCGAGAGSLTDSAAPPPGVPTPTRAPPTSQPH